MSHTLANLRLTVGKPAAWADDCAAKVPLVHRITSSEFKDFVSALIDSAFPEPSTIRKLGGLDKKLARQPAIYFFAGHLFPKGGVLNAFVFGPDSDTQLAGKGTPFDSGGVLDHHCLACKQSLNRKKQYLRDHECDLSDFREYFALYLTAHFESFDAYLAYRPIGPIDDCGSLDDMDIYSCAFEVRHENALSFPESTKVYVAEIVVNELLNALEKVSNIGKPPDYESVTSPTQAVREYCRSAVR